jgi:branched-chain amino acid transport system permease protein
MVMLSLIGQLIFDGMAMGLVYVVLAAGLVLILSVSEIFLIAYGQFYMIGAYAVWYSVHVLHLPFFAALLIGILTTGILGVLSYILIFQRLQYMEGRFLATITAALGLTLILGQAGLLVFGTVPRSIPTVFPGMIDCFGVNISVDKLALMGLGVAVTVFLFLVHEKASIGRAMRAVSLLPEAASLHGINTNRIYLVTLGFGTALAGFAGGIIAPSYGINPEMGTNIIVSVLLITMLGGMDSLMGAVAGGLVVGLVLSFGQFFIGGTVQIFLFIVIGVIIYFRPAGLLGRRSDFGGLGINV